VSAVAAMAKRRVDLLDVFIERAGARAYLWSSGEYELADAVDKLQFDAKLSGLIERIGQDAVQQIIANAFWEQQAEEPMLPDGVITEADIAAAERWEKQYPARRVDPITQARPTPQTTIEAIMFCVRERGPPALHEPANIERLNRCDDAAIAEIDARTTKLGGGHAR